MALALCLCLGTTAVDAASMWKWRDASGRTVVSDQPPPQEVPERDILERPAPRPPRAPAAATAQAPGGTRPDGAAAAASAARVDPELEARRRAEQAKAREAARAATAEDPQVLARKRENCQRARATLTQIDSGRRMARLNDNGERVVLDDAARAQEARRAREVIASECL